MGHSFASASRGCYLKTARFAASGEEHTGGGGGGGECAHARKDAEGNAICGEGVGLFGESSKESRVSTFETEDALTATNVFSDECSDGFLL
jgi:hypothetical protein